MYSIIDIEGDGGPYRKENIIEIAIFKYDGHEILDRFITLVNPESDITSYVQKLTKITPKMVKTAPKFHEIAKRVIEITEGTTLVGHNIDFDYRMLRQSFKRLGYDFKINTLDTIPLSKKLIPDESSYSLGKLCKSLGIPLVDEHRASGDARATLELFKLLITKDVENQIIQQHHEESNAKNYINKIKDLTEDLPAEKGIVYFQNSEGKILFCDYVDDIYKFSKKIFNSKSKRWENIQQDVTNIQYEITGTDLIAKLMLLNKNIKKNQSYLFGLFFKNNKYVVERISLNKNTTPLLKFKNFSQGQKVVQYIKTQENFSAPKDLENTIDFRKQNLLLISKGRTLAEKSFLVIVNGRILGYGFYEFYHQITSMKKINALQVNVKNINKEIINDVKLSLLKGDFEKRALPK